MLNQIYKSELIEAAGTVPIALGYHPPCQWVEVNGAETISVQMKQTVADEGSLEVYISRHEDNFVLDATLVDDSIYEIDHNVGAVKLVAAGTVSATNSIKATLNVNY